MSDTASELLSARSFRAPPLHPCAWRLLLLAFVSLELLYQLVPFVFLTVSAEMGDQPETFTLGLPISALSSTPRCFLLLVAVIAVASHVVYVVTDVFVVRPAVGWRLFSSISLFARQFQPWPWQWCQPMLLA